MVFCLKSERIYFAETQRTAGLLLPLCQALTIHAATLMIGKPRFMVRRVLNGQTRDTIRVSISLLETPDLGGSWKYIVHLTAVCGEREVCQVRQPGSVRDIS